MLRIVGATCCAVLVVGALTTSSPVASEGTSADPFGAVETSRESISSERRIEEVLDAPLRGPLQFEELPLNEILDIVEDEYDIPIVIDAAALDEVAVSPDIEVSIDIRNVSLRKALELLFRQPGAEDLTFIIEEEVLLILSRDREDSIVFPVVYRVDDLETDSVTSSSGYPPLVDVITSCVEKDSWAANETGDGEIRMLQPGILVVSQTPRVHAQLVEFFENVRRTRSQMESTIASEREDVLETRGFWIMNMSGQQFSEDDRQTIIRSIVDSVDWDHPDEEAVWIRQVGNRILVRHRGEILRQVEQVIDQIGMSPRGAVGSFGGGGGGFGGGGF